MNYPIYSFDIQNADLGADTILNFVLQETGINIEIDAMVS